MRLQQTPWARKGLPMTSADAAHLDPPMPFGRPSRRGEPTWEVAAFYPTQGEWSESEYLRLERRGRKLLELVHGCLEIHPRKTIREVRISLFLSLALDEYLTGRQLGRVLTAPCPVRLGDRHFRAPDVFFLRTGRTVTADDQPEGADLVVEIVSPEPRDRQRDLVEKRRDYAQAAIPEYWIVDPQEQTITVLVLDGEAYREDQVCKPGEKVRSILLPGFEVDVAAVLAAGE